MTVGKCCCCTDGVQTTRGKHCHACLVRMYARYLLFFVTAGGVLRTQGQQLYYYFEYCCGGCNTNINRGLIPVQPCESHTSKKCRATMGGFNFLGHTPEGVECTAKRDTWSASHMYMMRVLCAVHFAGGGQYFFGCCCCLVQPVILYIGAKRTSTIVQ